MPAVGKKLHHQVPQFYLKAWGEDARAVENAYVFCLQNGKIRLSQPFDPLDSSPHRHSLLR
jgi:hypothetical protein